MITESMIKRVAMALKAEVGRQLNAQPLHTEIDPTNWHATGNSIDLEMCAIAAIKEMREPTNAMVGYGMWSDSDRTVWHSMIDEALLPT